MQLIYGTKNIAKIAWMQKCMRSCGHALDLEIIGLDQLNRSFPDIAEEGNNPLDNARTKALAYYQMIKKPVFSCDSGLYFDGLPEDLQPGLHIRRVQGKRLNDDEMILHYALLAKEHGGQLIARYINGICLVMDDHLTFEYMGEDIATQKFIIAATPHEKRVQGFPLDSLSVHIQSNTYYFDLHESKYDQEEAWHTSKGFCRFFTSAIHTLATM